MPAAKEKEVSNFTKLYITNGRFSFFFDCQATSEYLSIYFIYMLFLWG